VDQATRRRFIKVIAGGLKTYLPRFGGGELDEVRLQRLSEAIWHQIEYASGGLAEYRTRHPYAIETLKDVIRGRHRIGLKCKSRGHKGSLTGEQIVRRTRLTEDHHVLYLSRELKFPCSACGRRGDVDISIPEGYGQENYSDYNTLTRC